MECPHCQKELTPTIPCPACQRPAITGAGFCHHCGHELPAPDGEPPKLLTCDSCGHKALPAAHYCDQCGESLGKEEAVGQAPADGERQACSDGMCIGIIGPDGKCTECGQPYNPQAE